MCEADLNELATMTRIPRAVLLRETVDDLLEKHRVIWSRSRHYGVPSRGIHRATLKSGKPKVRGQLPAPRSRQYLEGHYESAWS